MLYFIAFSIFFILFLYYISSILCYTLTFLQVIFPGLHGLNNLQVNSNLIFNKYWIQQEKQMEEAQDLVEVEEVIVKMMGWNRLLITEGLMTIFYQDYLHLQLEIISKYIMYLMKNGAQLGVLICKYILFNINVTIQYTCFKGNTTF